MSSYIGNIDSERVNPSNTVDVITVQTGVFQYNLSQDVPGAFEANVMVIKNGLILNPEVDYAIDYSVQTLSNTLITFNVALNLNDQILVIHRGSATYNLAPSPKSVTEDSLADNLRDMIFDSFTGNNTDTDFNLSKREYQPRSLLVSLNGLIKQPFVDIGHPGDYTLVQDDINNISKLHFYVAPGTSVVISVLHLAFSTVLRRSDYLTSILIAPNTIQTIHINDNAVTGPKILLANNEALRSSNAGPGTSDLIKLNVSDQADILGAVTVDSTAAAPTTNAATDLGTVSKKFKDAHLSGTATVDGDVDVGGDVGVTGDLTVTGNLNISGLTGDEAIGVIKMFYDDIAPVKYLLCDGSTIPVGTQYDALRAICLAKHGSGTTPDMRQRIAIGKKAPAQTTPIGLTVGETGGTFQHNHTVANHNHGLTNTNVHLADSGHYHTSGTYSVVVPGHLHAIASHSHSLPDHFHAVPTFHMHNIATDTWTQADHTHQVDYLLGNPGWSHNVGNSSRQVTTSGSPDGSARTEAAGGFSHSHGGATVQIGGSGAPNWGTAGSTSISGVGVVTSSPLVFFNTTYSTSLNTLSTTDATRSVAGQSDSSVANVTVQAGSSTENNSGMVTDNNLAISQPYTTINFIIRALA